MATPQMVDLRALLPEDLIGQPRILILLSLHACILIFPHVDADEAQHPKGKPDDVSSKAQSPSHNHDRHEMLMIMRSKFTMSSYGCQKRELGKLRALWYSTTLNGMEATRSPKPRRLLCCLTKSSAIVKSQGMIGMDRD